MYASDVREWFLYGSEGSQGPYTAPEIRSWIETGAVTPEWSVWREGMAAWQRIADTPELFPSAPEPAPAPAAPAAPTFSPAQAAGSQSTDSSGVKPASKPRPLPKPKPRPATRRPAPIMKPKPQRPGCITALCILVFIGGALVAIGLLGLSAIQSQLPAKAQENLNLLITLGLILIGIRFVAAVGLWMMQKWGAILFIAAVVLDQIVTLYFGLFELTDLVVPGIIIFGILKHLDQME